MARATRAAVVLAGCAVMAYGAWGLFASHAVPHSANLLVWLTASVLGHDGVIAPAVFALCWAGTRLLPPRARPWAAGALLVGGTALLVGLAALLGKGRDSNPTVLPLDYGRNILVVLLIVAAAAAAGAAIAIRAARHGTAATPAAPPATAPLAATPAAPPATAPRQRADPRGAVAGPQDGGKSDEDHKNQQNHKNHESRKHQEHGENDAANPGRQQQGNHSDERQP